MQAAPVSRTLRVLTYNVHSCRGTDGKTDPARIAEVIARCEPDIIALQELDVGRKRSGGIDQAQAIAMHLNVTSHFHPALHLAEERYGDAILTAMPSRVVKAGLLPSTGEPRGALWAAVDVGGTELHVFTTHFGLRRRERIIQAAAIRGPGWMGSSDVNDGYCVLLGDFNAVPQSVVYRDLARDMTDAHSAVRKRARPTFPSRLPLLRIDHIFVSEGVAPLEAAVLSDPLARCASDHLPLTATIRIDVGTAGPRSMQPGYGTVGGNVHK